VADAYDLNLVPTIYPNGTTASDHASFWDEGFPAVLAIEDFYPTGSGDFNPNLHKTSDLLSSLDMAYYTENVKLAVGGLAHMSNCLLKGTLDGQITSAHDGSALGGASVSISDMPAHHYAAAADAGGLYAAPLPAATYTVTATAYGYLPAVVEGIAVAPAAVRTQSFALQAAPPIAPSVTDNRVTGSLELVWSHVAPNTAYHIHRSTAPYFTPAPGNQIETMPMPFADTLTYADSASGAGNPDVNHFYIVVGATPGGQGAASDPIGEFDFALTTGS
jgi:hypothetical protein